MLAGLHQTEMPFGKDQCCIARDRTEHGQTEHGDGLAGQPRVARTADLVEDHAADAHICIVRHEAARHGRGGLRLRGHVEHQNHGETIACGKIGAGAGAASLTLDAVEQPHGTFDDGDVCGACFHHQRVKQGRPHRPAIQIDAAAAGCRSVKGGIDEIRAGLGRTHAHAAPFQCGEQA